ncbi:MAG TPA: hypothetical protein VLK78_08570 [Candidatus Angelobacter sp.]|nr:hypothetical protein [Candidatus Angelobacter sp.]
MASHFSAMITHLVAFLSVAAAGSLKWSEGLGVEARQRKAEATD